MLRCRGPWCGCDAVHGWDGLGEVGGCGWREVLTAGGQAGGVGCVGGCAGVGCGWE